MYLWRNCLPFRGRKENSKNVPEIASADDDLPKFDHSPRLPFRGKKASSKNTRTTPLAPSGSASNTVPEIASADGDLLKFDHFPRLPAELRIKIWEYTFVPRVVTLKRHSDRPCDVRSVEGLLMVNHEARHLFLNHYTRYFDVYGLKGIYIDFDQDTVSLSGKRAMKDLIKLLKQYTHTMSKVKYLDIMPEPWRGEFDWDRCSIQKTMSSLELLTVKLPSILEYTDRTSSQRSPLNLAGNINTLARVMAKHDRRNLSSQIPRTARLAAIFSPTDTSVAQLEDGFIGMSDLRLMKPSDSTWERIEATMSDEWKRKWPGRDNCRDQGWFVSEFQVVAHDH